MLGWRRLTNSAQPYSFAAREGRQDQPSDFVVIAALDPDLVTRDAQGKPYTVRYDAVNAMLLNEFLKEHRKAEEQHRKVEELEAKVAQQEKDFAARLKELDIRG